MYIHHFKSCNAVIQIKSKKAQCCKSTATNYNQKKELSKSRQ